MCDAASDRVVGAAGTGDALVAGAVYEGGDHVLEDDPVREARIVAAERMAVHVHGQQRRELVPEGFEQA